MNIDILTFEQLLLQKKEGIVLLGAGGDLQEWLNGVQDIWVEEGIEVVVSSAHSLVTTGGRVDLVLLFDKADYSRLALWRLKVGDCSWLSDYKVNYAEQHVEA